MQSICNVFDDRLFYWGDWNDSNQTIFNWTTNSNKTNIYECKISKTVVANRLNERTNERSNVMIQSPFTSLSFYFYFFINKLAAQKSKTLSFNSIPFLNFRNLLLTVNKLRRIIYLDCSFAVFSKFIFCYLIAVLAILCCWFIAHLFQVASCQHFLHDDLYAINHITYQCLCDMMIRMLLLLMHKVGEAEEEEVPFSDDAIAERRNNSVRQRSNRNWSNVLIGTFLILSSKSISAQNC